MTDISPATNNQFSQFYTPTELIHIFSSILDRQNINQKIIWMRGVYLLGDNPNFHNYDKLRDESTGEEITLFISNELKEKLSVGNLIMIAGVIDRRSWKNGSFSIQLKVTRFEVIQEQTISEIELKQAELRNQKVKKGYKNVDAILENKLYVGGRPKIALLYADGSITHEDFIAGKASASSHIDFDEYRVSFAKSGAFVSQLTMLDNGGYDIVAIIRGGGTGLDHVDDINVSETVVNMKTPIISAVGHENDKIFLKNIADKTVAVPHALGTYFKDVVERVDNAKRNSQAIMHEQVKKQFVERINTSEKQNKDLQDKLTALTKNNEASQKIYTEQIKQSERQNKDLQGKLTIITKNGEANQCQLKELTENNKKQAKDFNENISKMQLINNNLQNSLDKLNAQNIKSEKDLAEAKTHAAQLEELLAKSKKGCVPGCLSMIIALVGIIGIVCYCIVVL